MNKSIKILSLFLLVSIDQITKILIRHHLSLWEPVTVFPKFLELLSVENVFQPNLFFLCFYLFSIPTILILLYFFRNKNSIISFGFLLTFSGLVGNGIDRALFGKVTDFIHFTNTLIVFNFADIFLFFGTLMLLSRLIEIVDLLDCYVQQRKKIKF
jgi:signal peptidase II